MGQAQCKFFEARNALLKALTDYQTATRDMSLALERVSSHTSTFYESLNSVVHTSGSLLTPRR